MARNKEHASFFTYSIQRPYPLRWFTPVALGGGLVFTILISFANFVASGYELTSVYASDPNSVEQNLWFKRWPSWLTGNIKAACEPANLPVNTQFFTNQTGLSYTLLGIRIEDSGTSTTSPSLPYQNEVFKQCEVLNISMAFDCSTHNPPQQTPTTCTIDVLAYLTCAANSPNGLTSLNISSLYNPWRAYTNPGSAGLVDANALLRASLWWAQELLLAYWFDTIIALFQTLSPYDSSRSAYNNDKGIRQGWANFYRHKAQQNIMELDFFDVSYGFTGTRDGTVNGIFYAGSGSVQAYINNDSNANMSPSPPPPIWTQADRLAKVMYSAVMTDLGQTTLPEPSNVLANPDHLHIYSEVIPTLLSVNTSDINGLPYPKQYLHNITYGDPQEETGPAPLGVTPSVISTEYLCSVPRLKSVGNIFISILLADLVFLNTAWVLYCLAVERFFIRSATANYCEGCKSAMHEMQPLAGSPKIVASSVPRLPALQLDAASSSIGYEPIQPRRAQSSDTSE